MGKPLTSELIFAKSKTNNLNMIRNLNLWGNDLDDLKVLRSMPNLEVLSLSVNQISTLKEFANCIKLQELYLRRNNVSDLREIQHLKNLRELRVLWLSENPCAEIQNYRDYVIKLLPNLIKLDDLNITTAERSAANKLSKEDLENIVDHSARKVEEKQCIPNKSGKLERLDDDEERLNHAKPSIARSNTYDSKKFGSGADSYESKKNYYDNYESKKYSPHDNAEEVSVSRHFPVPDERPNSRQYSTYEERPLPASKKNDYFNEYVTTPTRDAKLSKQPQKLVPKPEKKEEVSENIICAMLALIKELDKPGLELVKSEIEARLKQIQKNK